MSTQKDIKTPDTKGEKTGNITAYSKSKLSGKPICRKTIEPITQQLKVNSKTIEESLLDPMRRRNSVFFIVVFVQGQPSMQMVGETVVPYLYQSVTRSDPCHLKRYFFFSQPKCRSASSYHLDAVSTASLITSKAAWPPIRLYCTSG